MQQQNTVGDMYSIIGQAMKPFTELMELAAIWYHGVRYTKGDLLNYDPTDTEVIEKDPVVTHRVIKCMGTINNSRLEMELEDIDTKELITITL